MRLCRFSVKGKESFGAVVNEAVVDLQTLLVERENVLLADPESLLAAGSDALALARRYAEDPAVPRVPLAEVQLLAPLSHPGKILCMGLNYHDHCKESGATPPKNPIWFPKFANAIQHPGAPVELPPLTQTVDYEGELGVILGRQGRNIAPEDALEYVFGYTVLHDVSARDLQFADGQWGRSKSFDTFLPMGPWIVTRDEITDPNNLSLKTYLNGELMQDSNTREMIFPVRELVSFLSQNFTFAPGDVLSTGTPVGVGAWRDPKVFLRHGDTVRIEIEGIGTLENPIVRPPKS